MSADRQPYSYRSDPRVPALADDRPVVIFDGLCVLCSAFVRFLLKRDSLEIFVFGTAQGPVGQALYRHYGLDPGIFETNLVIVDGCLHTKLGAFAAAMGRLPWPWRALAAVALIPEPFASWLYDRVARNRYALFGRYENCVLPPTGAEGRFL